MLPVNDNPIFLKKETIDTFLEPQEEKRGKRSRKLLKKIMAGFSGGSVGKESACHYCC